MADSATAARQTKCPDGPAFPGLTPDDLCLFMDEGVYGEVQDAEKRTRGAAVARFASEAGCLFTEVRCVVRYLRIFTRQHVWDGPGRDRWIDDYSYSRNVDYAAAVNACPTEPPAVWEPTESMPCWEFCEKGSRGARRVYVCEVKGQERVLGKATA